MADEAGLASRCEILLLQNSNFFSKLTKATLQACAPQLSSVQRCLAGSKHNSKCLEEGYVFDECFLKESELVTTLRFCRPEYTAYTELSIPNSPGDPTYEAFRECALAPNIAAMMKLVREGSHPIVPGHQAWTPFEV
eukprot:gnl/Hemi2/3210_TR1128_c0_g1_i1.p2 gnl/Hemi2/3210_TR1128_c0_g1~~gnl/Hemi2/3210_TR1128_c0_g1_i1.p2  ORF type:complete len:137 (+),score=32.92 gnl/Hemi2/3210_TR1128_c0_g1_i1:40-450(+)